MFSYGVVSPYFSPLRDLSLDLEYLGPQGSFSSYF